MEYLESVNINEAVIHILDNNSDEPILNEYKLNLNDDVYSFLLKHIEKCLKDEELKYAIFNEGDNFVRQICYDYLNGSKDLLEVSKELSKNLFDLIKNHSGDIPSCDLIIVSISTEIGVMMGIFKMDYIKNYTHKVDFSDNKIDIDIIPQFTGLPISSQRIQKCAFVFSNRNEKGIDLMVIDKQKKKEKNYYFINEYLNCKVINNARDMTKGFVNASEQWIRENVKENADKAEIIRSAIKKKLKEEDTLNVDNMSQELFLDKEDEKQGFKEYMVEQGVGNNINIDKQWVEKKLKRVRLKIDKDIDLYINQEAYNDNSKFQIQRVGDGSINIVIKNVVNYIEK